MGELDDASASWNGFIYQGKVALLLGINLINDLKFRNVSVDNFWLEVEKYEDFSLGYLDNYISIHQVKNYSDGNFSKYEEALLKLVLKVKKFDKKAFLHTSVKIENTDLKEMLPKILNNPSTNLIKNYKKELNKIDNITDEIFKQLKKNNKGKSKVRKNILEKLRKTTLIDLNSENLSDSDRIILKENIVNIIDEAINKEKKLFIFTESELELLFDNLNIYKYSDNSYGKSSIEIYNSLLKEFQKFWGSFAKSRRGNFELYYIRCLNIINNTIMNSAEKLSGGDNRIFLKEFCEILNNPKPAINTEEINLLQIQAKIERAYSEYCTEFCNLSECSECSLGLIISTILSFNIEELKLVIKKIALDNLDDLKNDTCEFINYDRLNEILFNAISSIDCQFFINQHRILSEVKKDESIEYIMASVIKQSKKGRKKNLSINHIISNPESEDTLLPSRIVEIEDINLMEVDKIITENIDEDDIFSYSNKILDIGSREEDIVDKNYNKITNTKKVGLISIDSAIKNYGGRK